MEEEKLNQDLEMQLSGRVFVRYAQGPNPKNRTIQKKSVQARHAGALPIIPIGKELLPCYG